MSYAAALQRLKNQNPSSEVVPKVPKGTYVTYGTPSPREYENFSVIETEVRRLCHRSASSLAGKAISLLRESPEYAQELYEVRALGLFCKVVAETEKLKYAPLPSAKSDESSGGES